MSWLDEEEVDRLREVYNKEHKTETPIAKGTPEQQWRSLQDRLHEKCNTGTSECIISSLLHRPRAPKEWVVNRYEWLSSDDIAAVEKNYEDIFVDYCFIGCVPIDFDLKSETQTCLVSALCKAKLDKLYESGHHRIGIVFNTDPHDGPGEHWVSVFCDIRPELEFPRITYFDSYAHTPEKEIQTLMKRWKEQWDATKIHGKPMKMSYNATRHQFKDSECGMYCLYFHYACLLGVPMETQIPDDIVNGFRNLLFTMPKE
jgi:Ulp1 protease family, C-terminal catalytic domain